jgi:transposase-like protein
MPWKGVAVNEERQRFLEDYKLRYYSITELAERFGISRKTAHKWIERFEHTGQTGFHDSQAAPLALGRPIQPSSQLGISAGAHRWARRSARPAAEAHPWPISQRPTAA